MQFSTLLQATDVQQIGLKILEISKKIQTDRYEISWTEIELTTCGMSGPTGPTLEQCIKEYDTEWAREKKYFNVERNRPGIQQVTIPKTGLYEIEAYGAGNVTQTASGTVSNRFKNIVKIVYVTPCLMVTFRTVREIYAKHDQKF